MSPGYWRKGTAMQGFLQAGVSMIVPGSILFCHCMQSVTKNRSSSVRTHNLGFLDGLASLKPL